METLQYRARYAICTGCIGASVSSYATTHPSSVELKGKGTAAHPWSFPSTANYRTSGCKALSRKTRLLGERRNSFALKQSFAALAVEGSRGVDEEERPNVAKLENPSIHVGNPDVQRTKLEGSRSSTNKLAVATDYIKNLPEFLKDETIQSPCWFCPVLETKAPPNAPVLLFLPEVVGTGLGFAMQQENLGRLFELRCLRIPLMDRTAFQGLVSFVEGTVRDEARLHPGRPIYLLGESFGAALALAVASRNPKLDLVLILVNSITSFEKSPLQPLLPLMEALPPAVFPAVPVLLGLISYDPVVLASQFARSVAPSLGAGQTFPENLSGVLQSLLEIVDALPKSVLPWKMNLLKSSARYVNSRLRAVKADVLILASVKDQLLPSVEEARRLRSIIPNSTYRKIPEGGHMLLVEEGFELASVIKGTGFYRRTRSNDAVSNFVAPTREEIERADASFELLRSLISPVFFSTGDDGQVVPGVSMIPTSKQPLIFIGNHFFYGLDMGMVWGELVNKLGLLPRGLAHPIIFDRTMVEENDVDGDRTRLFGGVPVCGRNMFKMLSRGESIALYPGGAREALHRKNEWHQLFWPERPEIVRMAARFGATFIPMCAVGEDEIYEILLDYDDLINLPIVGGQIYETFDKLPKLREGLDGEVGKQTLHVPVVVPKLGGPGRMYILFGKPIYTEGKAEYLRDPKNEEEEYQRLKAAVEDGISYLLNKRKEDPYKEFLPRIAYEIASGRKQAPTFEL